MPWRNYDEQMDLPQQVPAPPGGFGFKYRSDPRWHLQPGRAITERIPAKEPIQQYDPTRDEMAWKRIEESRMPENPVQSQPSVPSDFAMTMHAATRGMSDEDRTAYLSNFRNRLAERLQSYEWRLTRGITLSKEQNALYKKLLEQLQTLSEMMETPERISKAAEGSRHPGGRSYGQNMGLWS